jgi:hypothetical protein
VRYSLFRFRFRTEMPPITLNNKYIVTSINNNYKFVFVCIILVSYFAWMDISLFMHLQNYDNTPAMSGGGGNALSTHAKSVQPNHASSNSKEALNYINAAAQPNNLTASPQAFKQQHRRQPLKVEAFGVFHPLSVKLIMIDHCTHYVHDVVARFLEDTLHFTNIFPWATANFVSLAGLAMAITASRLIISDNVSYMRLGALLFEMRNLADSLDGVVFRSHERQSLMREAKLAESLAANSNELTSGSVKVMYQSHYGSVGYNVDAVCDGLGGLFFVVAILIKFLRHLPNKCKYFQIELEL